MADMVGELEATGRNVYLLQTSLDKVSKAARAVVDQWNNPRIDMEMFDLRVKQLAKALNGK